MLDYIGGHWQQLLALSGQHLALSFAALALGLLVAGPISLLAARYPGFGLPVFWLLGALYTVPSLALLAILIPFLGLGTVPAVVVLAGYSQLFLVRNTVAGLRYVDSATLEAATAMGMTGWQRFRQVQLPLALPIILAGVRVSMVTIISMATVMAWINAGGLGLLLFDGIARDNQVQILAGAIAVVLLALLADQLMRRIERAASYP